MCSISGIKWDSHLTSDPTSLSAKIDVIHTKIIKTVKPIMVSFIQFRVETLLAKKAWTSLPGIAVYWSSAKAKESSTSWSNTVEITCIDRVCNCIVHRKRYTCIVNWNDYLTRTRHLLLSLGRVRSIVALWPPHKALQSSRGYARRRNTLHIFSIYHQSPMERQGRERRSPVCQYTPN